ncbi:SMP-30/gluconolactonase/LRE family protein [Aestuariibacter sp. A3R04]|uniref:SMP-30/gluconolactonase/LRE family protein n=1 Tax=Aestuariibacter sp. A3R04 TaxID=2841571 RepID=UPI001C08DC08|nr:SMP-30/gluconolactonase/LRE family protein [Aestuariibacter sp. A3R04]MBU3020713.1 SMP-30/gluconolactonase/LRE family protein [Aestuariibacter sp. A3R04]
MILSIAKIPDRFTFLEGPAWSADTDSFYFSNMNFTKDTGHGPLSDTYTMPLGGQPVLWLENSGSNGLFVSNGKLYAANHKYRSVCILQRDCDGLVEAFQGGKFHSPNDLVVSKKNRLFFTDPDWQLWGREKALSFTGLYALDLHSNTLVLVDDQLNKPNGVALSVDESRLYVGTYSNQVYMYDVDGAGAVNPSGKKVFAAVQAPDGIAVDEKDNVYIASHDTGSIFVFTKSGKLLEQINVGEKLTNLCFGGKAGNTLLITTATHLFLATTKYKGAKFVN